MNSFEELFGSVDGNQNYLYHYTSAEAALGGILPLQRLRASPRAWLNDPLENEKLNPAFTLRGDDTTKQSEWGPIRAQVEVEFETQISQFTKILCFSMDRMDANEHTTVEGRGFGHSAMWSHYADSHRGVCLVIDKSKLNDEIQKTMKWFRSGAVKYKSIGFGLRDGYETFDVRIMDFARIKSMGPTAAVSEHIEKNFNQLFLTKLADWELEHEYRWIARTEFLGPAFISIHESLVGVVTGARFAESDDAMLHDLLKPFETPIAVGRLRFSNGAPQVSDPSRVWELNPPVED